ncbi:hypothetical protein GCM10009000_067700 [Halobacterium noricense]
MVVYVLHWLTFEHDGFDEYVLVSKYWPLCTTVLLIFDNTSPVQDVKVALKEPILYEYVDIAALEDSFFGSTVAGERRDAVGSIELKSVMMAGFRCTDTPLNARTEIVHYI